MRKKKKKEMSQAVANLSYRLRSKDKQEINQKNTKMASPYMSNAHSIPKLIYRDICNTSQSLEHNIHKMLFSFFLYVIGIGATDKDIWDLFPTLKVQELSHN